MHKLVAMAHENNQKIYLLGAKQQVVEKVAKTYANQYSQELVAGYRDGYFSPQQEVQIATDIAQSGAQLLFVAISSPMKENFLYKHRDILQGVHFIMGVGGSFDVVAGITKRAPKWMQNAGLEWFYRFAQEPKRMWRRYLVGNTSFIYLVLKEKFKKA
jgi:N-acetylglucosaminyldiphosphoundecaprenol N-acetyl-beta-D-mannosaminyltransferase